MTLFDLAELVAQMRDAQTAYFRGDRSSHILACAKSLERQVDRALKEILEARGQMALFREDGS